MNVKQLIEKYKKLEGVWNAEGAEIARRIFLLDLYQLDEPEAGHADEAPRYIKNILARLRELPLHDREVWLKAIMGEFERDFSRAKWREGYEQGKFEGMIEREKVKIPQFVADVIEGAREQSAELEDAFEYARDAAFRGELGEWFMKLENRNTFARAWLDGYELEKEKRYTVVMKETKQPLYYNAFDDKLFFSMGKIVSHFTRQQLEKLNFGWVFDCPGIEIEEVRE
jgi:hypothetical protein|nr:MAG TPA: Protein of unknown function (DUF1642) [Caudoviricetes sp.]